MEKSPDLVAEGQPGTMDTDEESTELQLDYLILIEVISLEIFRNLSFKDLQTCSLVNKAWNCVARKVLHESRKCATWLVLEEEKEEHNVDIIDFLQTTDQKLFNHLMIKMSLGNNHDCEQDCQKLLKQVELFPFKQTTFRRLSLWVSFSHDENCHAFLILKNIIRSISSDKVDHLTLYVRSFRNEVESCPAFHDETTNKFLFSNLKSVEVFVTSINKHDVYDVFLRNCPYLQEIVGKVDVPECGFLLSNRKAHLIKVLDLTQARVSDLDLILKFASGKPQLKAVYFDDSHLQYGSKFIWGEIFSLLCQSSVNSLQTVHTTLPMLNVMSQAVSSPLLQMKNLVISFKTENFDNYQLLKYIPLPEIFPNLKSVKIQASLNPESTARVNRIPEDFFKTSQTTEFVCKSVDQIELSKNVQHVYFEHSVIQMLAKAFPNVRTFLYDTITNTELQAVCRILWTVWDSMETIKIAASPSQIVSLEPCIIGVFEEEWDSWREMKRTGVNVGDMQFAPIRPSLRNCSQIRNFLIHMRRDASYRNFTQGLLDITNEVCPMVIKLDYNGAIGNP